MRNENENDKNITSKGKPKEGKKKQEKGSLTVTEYQNSLSPREQSLDSDSYPGTMWVARSGELMLW